MDERVSAYTHIHFIWPLCKSTDFVFTFVKDGDAEAIITLDDGPLRIIVDGNTSLVQFSGRHL